MAKHKDKIRRAFGFHTMACQVAYRFKPKEVTAKEFSKFVSFSQLVTAFKAGAKHAIFIGYQDCAREIYSHALLSGNHYMAQFIYARYLASEPVKEQEIEEKYKGMGDIV